MINQDVDDFLEHFGVKGMQWGVRKSSPERTAKKAQKALNKEARGDLIALQRTGQRYGYGLRYRAKIAEIKSKKENPAYAKAYKAAPGGVAKRQAAIGISMIAGYIFVNAALDRASAKAYQSRRDDFRNGYRSGGPGNGGPRPGTGGSRPSSRPTRSAADVINAERDVQISSLRRTHREGFMDDAQLENFLSTLNRRYDRRIADATTNT